MVVYGFRCYGTRCGFMGNVRFAFWCYSLLLTARFGLLVHGVMIDFGNLWLGLFYWRFDCLVCLIVYVWVC